MGHQLERLTHCLNCEQPTEGNFCANCGQENEDQTASLKAVFDDFLDDIIHFDSRLVRTVVPLLFKPGFLTTEYNRGKRVSYLSPYRMYLFVSAIFFLLLAYSASVSPGNSIISSTSTTGQTNGSTNAAGQTAEMKQTTEAISELKQNGILPKNTEVTESHNVVNIAVAPPNIGSILGNQKDSRGESDDDDSDGTSNGSVFGHKIDVSHLPATPADYDAAQRALPTSKRDPFWLRNLYRNIIAYKANPQSLEDRILDLIPKMTFFLVPLYAAALYPMYLRKKRYFVEHLIYSLHTHAFVFVIFTLILLLRLPAVTQMHALHTVTHFGTFLLLLSIPIYLYVSMKKVYGQSSGKTFVKFVIAWNGYFVLLGAAFAVVTIYALFF